MITKWNLSNFKSVVKNTELEFRPLTIFVGPNNSGKSSLIQSILLVSQTLAYKISSHSVVLNGALAQSGQFSDVVSQHSPNKTISIGWICEPFSDKELLYLNESRSSSRYRFRFPVFEKGDKISCNFSFNVISTDTDKELSQLQPSLLNCKIEVDAKYIENENKNFFIEVERKTDTEILTGNCQLINGNQINHKKGINFTAKTDKSSLNQIKANTHTSAQICRCSLRHFLPNMLSIKIDRVKQTMDNFEELLCAEKLPRNSRYNYDTPAFMELLEITAEYLNEESKKILLNYFGGNKDDINSEDKILIGKNATKLRRFKSTNKNIISEMISGFKSHKKEIAEILSSKILDKYNIINHSVPFELEMAIEYMDDFFTSSVKYLGPLRSEPKPLYPLSSNPDPSYVGLKGEFTASAIELYKSKEIEYVSAQNFQNFEQGKDIKIETNTLQYAIVDWLKYFDVAEYIETRDRGKLGYELKIKTKGVKEPHDLTHTGVGVSQVLPILVMCLLAKKDTTIILEQPELHLHPMVQSRLADFFLSMSLLGKQCIIETHSEYLINRLRLRSALDEGKKVQDLIKLYFVEKNQENSEFRDVKINEYGAILDWPVGFFDQSQKEAENILKAALNKKKKKKRNKEDD